MTDENEFDLEEMTNEELADYNWQKAVEHAETTLQLSENCFQKFGKRFLTETQQRYFENTANGILPTDDEQAAMESETITLNMEAVKRARELARQTADRLGEAYEPELVFHDRTDSAVN